MPYHTRAASTAALWLAVTWSGGGAAFASGFDVGGLMGGIGGIMQGAAQLQMQRDQMQQQLQMQKQMLQQQQQQPGTYNLPSAPVPASQGNLPADSVATRNVGSATFQVDHHALGSTLSYGELAELKCHDSEQFAGFEWCRGSSTADRIESGSSILRSSTGEIDYYSKFYPSAVFTAGAVKGQIDEISTQHHMSPRIETMSAATHGGGGVIATWGQVRLIKLDGEALKAIASTGEVREGVLVDFLSNARVSAKRGLPVFRLSGGAGYYWVSQWDRTGKGTLRFGIADASTWEKQAPTAPATIVATTNETGTGAMVRQQENPPAIKPDIASAAVGLSEAKPTLAPLPTQTIAPVEASPPPTRSNDKIAAVSLSGAQDPAPPAPAEQGRRVALIIVNSAYKEVDRLPNPDSDAEAVANALRLVGFNHVILLEDASLQQLREAFIQFQVEVDNADWAVVYYAGHGVQVSGQNFLIPVDAHLQTDRNIGDEAISLDYVLDKISSARRLSVVFLDACRNNPFLATMKRRIATRGVSRGLSPVEPSIPSQIVVYSAKAGEEAMDGDGSSLHSPFTQALLTRMATPGIEINKMLRMITKDVLTKTSGQQQPFVYGSTPGDEDFYFLAK